MPKPSPLLFLTRRRRALRRLVGLEPDVVYSTGWQLPGDLSAIDRLEDAYRAAARRRRSVPVVGQDRP